MFASGDGCKYTFLFKFSPCKKAVLMSIDFNWHSFEALVDNNTRRVSLEAVGDCFSNEVRASSSNPLATKRTFGSEPLLVFLKEHTHPAEIHF